MKGNDKEDWPYSRVDESGEIYAYCHNMDSKDEYSHEFGYITLSSKDGELIRKY